VALGSGYSGAFTTDDTLWHELNLAGNHSGEMVWRLPLSLFYTNMMTTSQVADLINSPVKKKKIIFLFFFYFFILMVLARKSKCGGISRCSVFEGICGD
jgi:hypothetical protein